ncbi:MAG: SusF/SusE family outer membrane protein [Bacteroides sp.]|nr:SusF/SusE family outer membrane protein [Bacteroides sp.]
MKKLFIFAAAVMGLGLVSCDQVDLPNPPAQSNPQEALFDKSDLEVVADPAAADAVYNLTDYQNEGMLVPLADIAKMDNVPSGFEVMFSGKVSGGLDFSGAEFACEVVDGKVMVKPDVFNGALRTVSKNPVDLTVNVQLYPYIVSVANPTFTAKVETVFGPFAINATPFAPTAVIEEAYYLLLSTDGSTWTAQNAVKSTHSSSNVYDDPEFTFIYSAEASDAAPMYWKIVPESVFSSDLNAQPWYTPVFADSFLSNGTLEANSTEMGQNISVSGAQVMTINMETLSFQYQVGFPQLYTPGESNGWNASASQILTTQNYTDYTGYLYLTGDFKFNPDTGWDGRDFGCNNPFEYAGSPLVGEGIADGGNNINVAQAGVYFVTLNYPTRATVLTMIDTYGLIGDATEGGWDNSTPLTMTSPLVYSADVKLKGSGEFKFRANNGWDINLGGNLSVLTAGGDNIATPGEGTYTVTLDLSQVPYSATVVKK